ncbi:MAG: hypothetical protein H7227_08290 [Actinobacteria bacterium]|nr:hypothetical protein [Actinomycetota bacterium]
MLILAIKLFLAPTFIVITSFLQKKYGARIGGVFVSIPFILTPILIVIYLQEGKPFFRDAIVANYAGQIGILLFIFTYSRLASKFAWPISILGATSAYLISILSLSPFITHVWVGLSLWTVVWLIVLKTYPTYDRSFISHASPWWEILLRIASALALIFIITHFAADLGPNLSGALAMYPVMTTVMSTFNHGRFGSVSAIALLHGMAQYLWVIALFPVAAFVLFL